MTEHPATVLARDTAYGLLALELFPLAKAPFGDEIPSPAISRAELEAALRALDAAGMKPASMVDDYGDPFYVVHADGWGLVTESRKESQ